MPRSDQCPPEVHTFWPFDPFVTVELGAVVEPGEVGATLGSLNSWHQAFVPVTMSSR
jgi:hypothetical protein